MGGQHPRLARQRNTRSYRVASASPQSVSAPRAYRAGHGANACCPDAQPGPCTHAWHQRAVPALACRFAAARKSRTRAHTGVAKPVSTRTPRGCRIELQHLLKPLATQVFRCSRGCCGRARTGPHRTDHTAARILLNLYPTQGCTASATDPATARAITAPCSRRGPTTAGTTRPSHRHGRSAAPVGRRPLARPDHRLLRG
ncbi:hypothetical protein D3C75_784550 [compost metagenome]